MAANPPKVLDRLLQWYCEQVEMEDIHGDLNEIYQERAEESKIRANLLFALDTLRLFNPFSKQRKRSTWLSESYHFNFRNQINQAVRNLKKYPFINSLKVLGLSVALCACFFINDYTSFHNTFDHFHEKKDQIYRVVTTVESPDLQDVTAWSHSYIKDLSDEFPEVEQIVRLLRSEQALVVTTETKEFEEPNVFFTDPEFAEVFSYQWLEGEPYTALIDPSSVILTKSMAKKYFDQTTDIVGRTLSIGKESYMITGLVDDIPANSDLKFDLLIPLTPYVMEDWMFVYMLVQKGTAIPELRGKLTEVVAEYNEEYTDMGIELIYDFENITEVHFSEPKLFDTPKIDRSRIVLFGMVGWIILTIALVNYINLYSTQLLQRIRSVNVQIVVGATKRQLIVEFLTESVLFLGIAIFFGVLLTWSGKDVVSYYADFRFFEVGLSVWNVVKMISGFFLIVMLSALYALAITTKRANNQLFETKTIKAPLRKGLIGVQFALSFVMILATLVIFLQTKHIQNQPLGFNPDQAIHFQFPDYLKPNKLAAIKNELTTLDFVEAVSQVDSKAVPGEDAWVEEYYIPEMEQVKLFEEIVVDDYYDDVLELNVLAGDFFDRNKHGRGGSLVVNKAFVDHFGWTNDDAIGKRLSAYGNEYPIVGVVDNFYFHSPHQLIQPLILHYTQRGSFAVVRLSENVDLKTAVARMELIWRNHIPDLPLNFSFLRTEYAKQFEEEQASLNVLAIIAGLVITLSLLGMYAILLMLGKAREKELGIRKVNGAKESDLFKLFSREFVKILVIAISLSVPVVWVILNNWLEDYPLRISLNAFYFFGVAILVMLIACFVIYLQATRSYRSNTIECLKYE